MKKSIIVIIISLIAIASSVAAYMYFSSFRNVSFDIKQPNVTVEIFESESGKSIKTITSSSSVSIRDGEYYYQTSGDRYESESEALIVTSDTSIIIDPAYSSEYLSSLLKPQEGSIHKLIRAAYPGVIGRFNIHDGKLFERGDWYGTILTEKVDDERQITDPYRVILKKNGETWEMLGSPEIVVNTSNQPEVPLDILRQVNDLLDR